ncbi:hypothetical protein FB451DRAFT_1172651 [Mycena latifolia]|nr:hypothetical protein FB451DRAFT_1172651 [Mycena latifolia]
MPATVDLNLYTESKSNPGTYYPRDLTLGRISPGGETFIHPQSVALPPHNPTGAVQNSAPSNGAVQTPLLRTLTFGAQATPAGASNSQARGGYTRTLSNRSAVSPQGYPPRSPPHHSLTPYGRQGAHRGPPPPYSTAREDRPRYGYRGNGAPYRGGLRAQQRGNFGMSSEGRHESGRPARNQECAGHNGMQNTQSTPSTSAPEPAPAHDIGLHPKTSAEARSTAAGHPLFPGHLEQVGWGLQDKRTREWHVNESTRLDKVTERGPPSQAPRPLKPEAREDVGPWYRAIIVSRFDGDNLLAWAAAGDAASWHKIEAIAHKGAVCPEEQRTEGVARVLKMHEVTKTAGPHRLKKAARRAHYAAAHPDVVMTVDTAISGSLLPITPPAPTEDTDMPDAANTTALAPPHAISLITPPALSDVLSATTSLDDFELWFWLTPCDEWDLGVRDTNGHIPTEQYAHPMRGDVRSVAFLKFISPEDHDECAPWLERTTTLMSVQGLYEQFVAQGGYVMATRPVGERFNFTTESFTLSHAAAWLVTHGLVPGSSEARALHSYGRSYRNHALGNKNPVNSSFTDWPHDATCVRNLCTTEVLPWHSIWFGALRPGLVSAYPRHPSETILAAASATPESPALDWSEDADSLPLLTTSGNSPA